MDDDRRSRLELLLDLLTDEVAKRLQDRPDQLREAPEPTQVPAPVAVVAPSPEETQPPEPEPAQQQLAQQTMESAPTLASPTPSHAASLMARLAIGVFIVLVLINIPLNAQGTAIARSIPSSASLVIANGLLVKEANSPDVWVYRDGAFHWITSLDAFEHFGYRWQDVHVVEQGFLSQFQKGSAVYLLLKCDGSPHIYQLDAGRKRWIIDIPTFEAQGFVWEDIQFVPCSDLRLLPDGDSVPPGHGTPPPPLP